MNFAEGAYASNKLGGNGSEFMEASAIGQLARGQGAASRQVHVLDIDPPLGSVEARIKSCQFIAGKPSSSDRCKCAQPTKPGSSYCGHHHALCWTSDSEDWADEPLKDYQ